MIENLSEVWMSSYLCLLFSVCYFRVLIIAVRKNSSRVQEAALSLLRWLDSSPPKSSWPLLELRKSESLKLSLLCWLSSFSVGSQLWCVTAWVLTWLILDFLDKENWFALFFLRFNSAIKPIIYGATCLSFRKKSRIHSSQCGKRNLVKQTRASWIR